MRRTKSIYILLSLFLISNCGDKVREEITERYENGQKKLLVIYKGEGSDEVIVERITYNENGDTLIFEKPLEKMKMVREYHGNGHIHIEENYKDGEREGKWKYYSMNGNLVGIFIYNEINKYIPTSNDYNDFLLGEWTNIYEESENDTMYWSDDNTLLLQTYFENKYISKRKGGEVYGISLNLDSLYDWVQYDIEFNEDGSYKLYNRNFLNVQFKEWRKEQGLEDNIEFICECKIIDYFTIIEYCSNKDYKFSSKSTRNLNTY